MVVVGSKEDVARVVRFVGERKVWLSVRSGGHSYSCTSSRSEGLQLDMRGLRSVELVQTERSSTGWAVRLGPGASWQEVLDQVSPAHWTVVHGQCLAVGVGGFTLGGGVNMVGTTARYGAAMEQVIQYQLVTARGEIITLDQEALTFPEGVAEDDPRKGTDLLFGLRGAGASFGVVTEFLVKVYPVPETLASVIPVWVSSLTDLTRLEAVARGEEGGGYQFGLYSLYYSKAVREPWSHPLLASSQYLARLKAWWENQPGVPLILSVADIRSGAGRRTNTSQVMELLQSAGVRLVFSSHLLLDSLSQEAGALGMLDYEGEYLTPSQRQSVGAQGLVSANLGGIQSIASLSDVLLHHDIFGNNKKVGLTLQGVRTNLWSRQFTNQALAAGCNYCFWAINFQTRPVRSAGDRISLTRSVGNIQTELTCKYTVAEKGQCRKEVEKVRERLLAASLEEGGEDSQYVNTPSCQGDSWPRRYFGDNYHKLLSLKRLWDPSNLFNYCQSIGSTSNTCCQ